MIIGFIGLGIMGKPMAKNLLKAGCTLLVHNRSRGAVDELVAAGAKAALPAEIAQQSDVIITMLPNGPDVEAVVLGDGLVENMRPGSILVDMSSINPGTSIKIANVLAEKGIEMLDAPVSGGEPKAIDGTLSIMVGGKREVFESVKDSVLLKMGSSAVYCGKIGAGNTTKLANQVVVACNIAACAEAFTLAKKTGVDPQLVFEAIKGGLAGSTVMNAKVPMMIDGNFKPGFKIDLHIKDLNNAMEAAHEAGSPLPLSALVLEMMHTLRADGRGQDDHSSLANYYAKVSGVNIGE